MMADDMKTGLPAAPKEHAGLKLVLELGPLLVFFFVNAKFNLFAATGAFMVAVTVAVVISWLVHRTLPLMALVTMVLDGVVLAGE